ncbi:MAG: MarR family winged helix-turn-helix transcriptional regulator [Rhizobiaceae bacterium]
MPSRVDPDSMGFLVTDVARLIRAELDRRIAEAGLGLTPGEGRTLVHIARAGGVRQTDLAERMGVEAMTVTGFLDRLEAKGLVERVPDQVDRRAKRVLLTEAAENLLEKIAPLSAGLRADASDGVPAEDWARFLEILKTVRANLTAARSVGAAA